MNMNSEACMHKVLTTHTHANIIACLYEKFNKYTHAHACTMSQLHISDMYTHNVMYYNYIHAYAHKHVIVYIILLYYYYYYYYFVTHLQ